MKTCFFKDNGLLLVLKRVPSKMLWTACPETSIPTPSTEGKTSCPDSNYILFNLLPIHNQAFLHFQIHLQDRPDLKHNFIHAPRPQMRMFSNWLQIHPRFAGTTQHHQLRENQGERDTDGKVGIIYRITGFAGHLSVKTLV